MGCAGILAVVVIGFMIGTSGNKQSTGPQIDARTGRPFLDHKKPIFVMAGAPACPSEDELDAERRGAPSYCTRVPIDMPAVEMDMRGIMDPVYRVRFLGTRGVVDAWVPYDALRN
jgi:hypothetical protein